MEKATAVRVAAPGPEVPAVVALAVATKDTAGTAAHESMEALVVPRIAPAVGVAKVRSERVDPAARTMARTVDMRGAVVAVATTVEAAAEVADRIPSQAISALVTVVGAAEDRRSLKPVP